MSPRLNRKYAVCQIFEARFLDRLQAHETTRVKFRSVDFSFSFFHVIVFMFSRLRPLILFSFFLCSFPPLFFVFQESPGETAWSWCHWTDCSGHAKQISFTRDAVWPAFVQPKQGQCNKRMRRLYAIAERVPSVCYCWEGSVCMLLLRGFRLYAIAERVPSVCYCWEGSVCMLLLRGFRLYAIAERVPVGEREQSA